MIVFLPTQRLDARLLMQSLQKAVVQANQVPCISSPGVSHRHGICFAWRIRQEVRVDSGKLRRLSYNGEVLFVKNVFSRCADSNLGVCNMAPLQSCITNDPK